MNKMNLRFHKIRLNWLWVATEIIDHQKWFFFWNSRYKIIEFIFLFFNLYIYAAPFCILCFKMEGYDH